MSKPVNIDCSLEHARLAFLGRDPVTAPATHLPGYTKSSDAAWNALAGHVRHRMEDGTVMLPDSLGRWHRLSPVHRWFSSDDLTACAFDDDGGCAIVSPSLVIALVSASIGIWCHPGFEPWVGNPGCVTLPPVASGIPFGFEQLVLTDVDEPDARAMMTVRRKWLDEAAHKMCPIRRDMAMLTVRQAAQWIWTHEAGHLLGGHQLLDIGGQADIRARSAKHPGKDQSKRSPDIALEILADRFATRFIMKDAVKGQDAQLRAVAIGGLLALSLFEAESVISGERWETTTHPGNWFRAYAFLGEIGCSTKRLSDWLPMLVRLASALGHCGQWLNPSIEGGYDDLAGRFIDDALGSLTPYANMLRANGAVPVEDRLGVSSDQYVSTLS